MTVHEHAYAEFTALRPAIDGDWLEVTPGERFAVRVSSEETKGRYTALEVVAAPGCGPPLHIHHNEDEHFVVLEGTVCFVCDDRAFNSGAGTAVTIPRGVRHTWANFSNSDVRMLITFSPGGFEGCFRALVGAAPDQFEAIATAYGCSVVGPRVRG